MIPVWKEERKHVSHNVCKCEDKNFQKIKFIFDIFDNKTTTNQLHNKFNTSSDLSHPVEHRMNEFWKKSIKITSRNTILIKADQNQLLLVRHVFSVRFCSKTIKQKPFRLIGKFSFEWCDSWTNWVNASPQKLVINKHHGENFKKISCCGQKSICMGLNTWSSSLYVEYVFL